MHWFAKVGRAGKDGVLRKCRYFVVEGDDDWEATQAVHRLLRNRDYPPLQGRMQLELTEMVGFRPGKVGASRITGTARAYADEIRAAMAAVGAVWYEARTAPPEFGKEGGRTYDSFTLTFKNLDLDWEWTRARLEAAGLRVRTLSGVFESAPSGWALRECRVERVRETLVSVTKLSRADKRAAIKASPVGEGITEDLRPAPRRTKAQRAQDDPFNQMLALMRRW